MRVFVTGASGFVGRAVTEELLAHGHEVTGLVRRPEAAEALIERGARVHQGDLAQPESLLPAVKAAEAVIHCGFNHDFSRFAESCAEEGRLLQAMGQVLKATGGRLIVTSGQMAGREDQAVAEDHPHPRAISERRVQALRREGVQAMALRLPPSTHGAGDRGFVAILIALARQSGVSAYIDAGQNRWPAVHRRDAARLYRLVLERGEAPCYHALAEEGLRFRSIAEAIGAGLGLPCRSLSGAEAEAHFTWFTRFAAMDAPASSAWTRAALGYQPSEQGLLQDMADHYFG